MGNANERDELIERRHMTTENSFCWDKLTMAQKFSASSLSKYGYDLAFVRSSAAGNIAVLLRDGRCAVISNTGEVNTSSDITIRL
ncbi:MAG: hypothetical protein HRT37_14225 [Alteromonadaceae bacterium]|nr:hypothetical protein [Alteromonadaceae bacterium]